MASVVLPSDGTLLSLSVSVGRSVSPGDVLGRYQETGGGVRSITVDLSGEVTAVMAVAGSMLAAGWVALCFYFRECGGVVVMGCATRM